MNPHTSASSSIWDAAHVRYRAVFHSPRAHREVWKILLPSTAATRPRNDSPSPPVRCARPAMGVRQEPSRAARNARSHTTARRVSSWFSAASSFRAGPSSSRQAMPIAPCPKTPQMCQPRDVHASSCPCISHVLTPVSSTAVQHHARSSMPIVRGPPGRRFRSRPAPGLLPIITLEPHATHYPAPHSLFVVRRPVSPGQTMLIAHCTSTPPVSGCRWRQSQLLTAVQHQLSQPEPRVGLRACMAPCMHATKPRAPGMRVPARRRGACRQLTARWSPCPPCPDA